MQTLASPVRIMLLVAAAYFILLSAPSRCRAGDPKDEVTATFFLQGGEYLVRFFYLTDDGSSVVERMNGRCYQKVAVPKATIAVFSFPEGELLAEGTGTLQIEATIDCERRFYTFERVIVTAVAITTDPETHERLRLNVRGIVIDGVLKTLNISLNPLQE